MSVDVTNTGDRTGDEVVQLYVKHLGSKVERPTEELRGFRRVTVGQGETQTVQIPLEASRLAYWDVNAHKFKVEAEPVSVMIGESATDIKLTATIHVR